MNQIKSEQFVFFSSVLNVCDSREWFPALLYFVAEKTDWMQKDLFQTIETSTSSWGNRQLTPAA